MRSPTSSTSAARARRAGPRRRGADLRRCDRPRRLLRGSRRRDRRRRGPRRVREERARARPRGRDPLHRQGRGARQADRPALAERRDRRRHRLRPRGPEAERDPADPLGPAEPLGCLAATALPPRADRPGRGAADGGGLGAPLLGQDGVAAGEDRPALGRQPAEGRARALVRALARRDRAERADARDRRGGEERDLPADPGHGRRRCRDPDRVVGTSRAARALPTASWSCSGARSPPSSTPAPSRTRRSPTPPSAGRPSRRSYDDRGREPGAVGPPARPALAPATLARALHRRAARVRRDLRLPVDHRARVPHLGELAEHHPLAGGRVHPRDRDDLRRPHRRHRPLDRLGDRGRGDDPRDRRARRRLVVASAPWPGSASPSRSGSRTA